MERARDERIEERLVRREERVSDLRHDVSDLRSDLIARIDGPPFERSLRGRLHKLEADSESARLAKAVLDRAEEVRNQSSDRILSRRQALIAMWTGAVIAACSVSSLVVLIANHHT